MKTTPQTLKSDFEALFGNQLTAQQLWLLTKFAKYVRLRARNNAAFNNLMNAVFPYARFSQVTKMHADSSSYPGLKIMIDGVETPENYEEEE